MDTTQNVEQGMDPMPNASKGVPVPAYNDPTGGPNSNQRQEQHRRRQAFIAKKRAGADGPSPCVPRSGPPDES